MSTDRKRDLLWVATTAFDETRGVKADELGHSAIVGYRLETGEEKHRFVLDGAPHGLGDVIVADDGTLYASDSRGGGLYAVDVKSGAFRALTKAGELASPQGMALARDGRHLYVADYVQGLFRYDLAAGTLERLEVAPGICVYGIDGLYRHRDQLIAIQNGVRPHRVVRLDLDDGGTRVRRMSVLAANLKAFDEPTLGVVVDKKFYFVANSQWNKFRDDHTLPPNDQLRRPQVLRIDLEGPDSARSRPEPETRPVPQSLPTPCVPPLC